jgi:phospholipid/cholesterol/gamma-HCH transport system substrate-binding protein/paraquat-inducible protein B
MNAKANYFKIGLFVVSAATIAVIAVIVLGAGAIFQEKLLMETYIKESVQGLDIGSPVKFRGVQVGNVEEITLTNRAYRTDRRYVLVQMALFPDAFRVPSEKGIKQGFKMEIEKGLRVRLSSQGLTGTAYLEADYLDPDRNLPLEIDWEPRLPYVPSAPSTITRLSDSVDRIFRRLEQIDVRGLTEGLEKSLMAVTQVAEAANVGKIGAQAEQLLMEVRETNRRLGKFFEGAKIDPLFSDALKTVSTARRIVETSERPIGKVMADLPEASASVKKLAKQLDSLMESADLKRSLEMIRLASEDLPETVALLKRTFRKLDGLVSSQQQEIEGTIENIRRISANLKELTENAKRYPSQILFGEPPTPSEAGNNQ